MGGRGRGTGYANYVTDYKRLGPIAKLATSYSETSPLRVAPCQRTPTPADTSSHQRPWLSEGVAAVYTGDGSGIDRSRVVAQRGPVLPGPAVAAIASAVAGWPGRWACKGAGGGCL